MTNEELILERLQRLEAQIAPAAASARAMVELRDELAPRVNEAVHALIVALADVEADFQLDDLLFLLKKLMRNVGNLNFTLDQLKNIIDFVKNAEPLMKATVPQAIFYLDDLEQRGVFRLASVALDVIKRISADFTAEELEQIAGGLVRLVRLLRQITSPRALDLLERLAGAPGRIDLAKVDTAGPKDLLRALVDADTRRGLGLMLALTKGLGHAE